MQTLLDGASQFAIFLPYSTWCGLVGHCSVDVRFHRRVRSDRHGRRNRRAGRHRSGNGRRRHRRSRQRRGWRRRRRWRRKNQRCRRTNACQRYRGRLRKLRQRRMNRVRRTWSQICGARRRRRRCRRSLRGVPARAKRHYRHSITALSYAVSLQQMVKQVLPRLEMLSTYRARLPLRRRRMYVGNVLLQIADAAINASALLAYRFRLRQSSVTRTATGTTSWNPTTARCH